MQCYTMRSGAMTQLHATRLLPWTVCTGRLRTCSMSALLLSYKTNGCFIIISSLSFFSSPPVPVLADMAPDLPLSGLQNIVHGHAKNCRLWCDAMQWKYITYTYLVGLFELNSKASVSQHTTHADVPVCTCPPPRRVIWTLELRDQALDKLRAVTCAAVIIGTS